MNKLVILSASSLLILGACASRKAPSSKSELEIVAAPPRPVIGGQNHEIPRAVVYKTNGDYNNNVTVQVDARGNITSYPAPADVKGMEPIALTDGWLLTRCGVNMSTVFTRYTYAQYAALKAAPTLAELKASIIPDAKITETKTLSLSQTEALANPSAILPYLAR